MSFNTGSEEERAAVRLAYRSSSRKEHDIYELPPQEVKFQLETPQSTQFGKDISIKLAIVNESAASRTIKGMITALMYYYTGVPGEDLKEQKVNFELEPGQGKSNQIYHLFCCHCCSSCVTISFHTEAWKQIKGQRSKYETFDLWNQHESRLKTNFHYFHAISRSPLKCQFWLVFRRKPSITYPSKWLFRFSERKWLRQNFCKGHSGGESPKVCYSEGGTFRSTGNNYWGELSYLVSVPGRAVRVIIQNHFSCRDFVWILQHVETP